MSEAFIGGSGAQAVTDYTGYVSWSGQMSNIYGYLSVINKNIEKSSSQIKNIIGIVTISTGGAFLTKFDEEKTFTEPASGASYKAKMSISGTVVSLLIASADGQYSSPTVKGVVAYN